MCAAATLALDARLWRRAPFFGTDVWICRGATGDYRTASKGVSSVGMRLTDSRLRGTKVPVCAYYRRFRGWG